MGNRKAATERILTSVEEALPGSGNREYYEKVLTAMSDEEFDQFIDKLRTGQEYISLTVPNYTGSRINLNRIAELSEKLGIPIWQHLSVFDETANRRFKTPKKYPVLFGPVRRQQQTLREKIGLPVHSRTIDDLTGQVTGESKGSSISVPQVHILRARQLYMTALEYMKVRGGDEKAAEAMEQQIERFGGFDLDAVTAGNTKVKSQQTVSIWFTGMHLRNNL